MNKSNLSAKIGATTAKDWPTYALLTAIAGIAWSVGYLVRWDAKSKRPVIRPVSSAKTNFGPAQENIDSMNSR
jgi:hypothetical protein